MGTAGGPNPEALLMAIILGGVVIGLVVNIVVGAICGFFTARAVAVVPPDRRAIGPTAIWGLLALGWALGIAASVATIFLVLNLDTAPAFLVPMVLATQIAYTLLQVVWTGWVGLGIPKSFTAGFEEYGDDPRVPVGDHGKGLGLWMTAMLVIASVFGLVATISQGDPAREIRRAREAMDQQGTGPATPPDVNLLEILTGCGSGLFWIVCLVLFISFLVNITKQRRAMLELQRGNPDDEFYGRDVPPTEV